MLALHVYISSREIIVLLLCHGCQVASLQISRLGILVMIRSSEISRRKSIAGNICLVRKLSWVTFLRKFLMGHISRLGPGLGLGLGLGPGLVFCKCLGQG